MNEVYQIRALYDDKTIRIYQAFDFIVEHAVPSSFDESKYVSIDDWKNQVKESSVRVQWDPERDLYGNPLEYRSIQLGIRGDIVNKYVDEWIVKITDLTKYVAEIKLLLDNKNDIADLLPKERIYSKFVDFAGISDMNFGLKSGTIFC